MEPGSSEGIISLVVRLARTMQRHGGEGPSISLRAFILLSHLRERGSVPQQELGEVMCVDANSTVLLLNDLEEEGLISRRRDPLDRRRHIIGLTAAGSGALARGECGWEEVENRVLSGLTADERAGLRALIARALDGVDAATGRVNARADELAAEISPTPASA